MSTSVETIDSSGGLETSSQPTPHARTDAAQQPVAIARRHDLDSLRAIAMLLGIVLHAALSFAPVPWPVQDTRQSQAFYVLFAAIHGFRMPLFFLLSGFFTAMLWRKRGLRGLIKQRLTRIGVPLLLSCVTIVPAMWAVYYYVSLPPDANAEQATVWNAVVLGDTDQVSAAIEASVIDVDAVSQDGASLLTVAVFLGHTEMVEMLLQAGANVDQRNRDGGTALHSAAFIGRAEEAALLLGAGANTKVLDQNGQSAQDLLTIDFATTNLIATSFFGSPLDKQGLWEGRAEIATRLGVPLDLASPAEARGDWMMLTGALFHFPVFMHLWFLWFLCWLVTAFVLYAVIAKILDPRRLPHLMVNPPTSLLWLVPLTMVPQAFMSAGSFGPDPSIGLLPLPSVLAYYAIFFYFGAIYWDREDTTGRLGRGWAIYLTVALLVVLPIGLEWTSGTFGMLPPLADAGLNALAANFCQALFAWLMTFGSMGLCHRLLRGKSQTMRFIADASYWLYLVHLPLVLLAQGFLSELPLPAFLKFAAITMVVSTLLLLTYAYFVRNTWIGRILNGRPTAKWEVAR